MVWFSLNAGHTTPFYHRTVVVREQTPSRKPILPCRLARRVRWKFDARAYFFLVAAFLAAAFLAGAFFAAVFLGAAFFAAFLVAFTAAFFVAFFAGAFLVACFTGDLTFLVSKLGSC